MPDGRPISYCSRPDCDRAGNRARARASRVPVWHDKTCARCGEAFRAKRSNTMYCSPRCSSAAFNARRREDGRAAEVKARSRRIRLQGRADAERVPPLEVFERDDWTCGICREPINRSLRWPAPGSASVDHVVPLAAGGSHDASNLQAAHLACNWRKGARTA